VIERAVAPTSALVRFSDSISSLRGSGRLGAIRDF